MNIFHFQKMNTLLALSLALAFSSTLLAGGVAGGGGPPAIENPELLLRIQLNIDVPLQSEVLLTRAEDASDAVRISAEDFDQVAQEAGSIEAVNRDGEVRTYELKKTLTPDTLLLVAPR